MVCNGLLYRRKVKNKTKEYLFSINIKCLIYYENTKTTFQRNREIG